MLPIADTGSPAGTRPNDGLRYLVAADTGGTFTDLTVFDTVTGETHFGKTLTTYGNLMAGVMTGLEDTGIRLDEAAVFKHGTTHVINAFIERRGARTALVTTKGFRDVLEIARGNRPETFNLRYRRAAPLVPRSRRFEVDERIAGDGTMLRPLSVADVERLVPLLTEAGVEAIAVSFLNAYVNPEHEQRAARILSEALPGVYVTAGAGLSREWMEYERTSTAAANAFVGARMSDYIDGFRTELKTRRFRGRFYLAGSSGGVMSAADAVAEPVALVESGPVGGCIGAAAYAAALGFERVVAFDMGGTTAKCALVEDGRFDVVSTYWVGGYERGFPIRTPVLDIVEVGAGGGSIAWLDDHGRMRLGPKSAGSSPGPIAFGRGGTEPTVTDANVVLGRIGSNSFMGGRLTLDAETARRCIREQLALPLGYTQPDAVERVAQGIIDLAAITMAGAIKEITVERGRDIRDYLLFAFGGGGPLFAADLARDVGIGTVVIPPHPGAFSALGMLMTEARRDGARTFLNQLSDDAVSAATTVFQTMEDELREAMRAEFDVERISFVREADMNYAGQSHSVRVSLPAALSVAAVLAAFETEYRARYGYLNTGTNVTFVTLRAGGIVPTARPSLQAIGPAGPNAVDRPLLPHGEREVYFARAGAWVPTRIFRRADMPPGSEIVGPAVVEEFSSTTVIGAGDRLSVGTLGELRIICRIENKGVGKA